MFKEQSGAMMLIFSQKSIKKSIFVTSALFQLNLHFLFLLLNAGKSA